MKKLYLVCTLLSGPGFIASLYYFKTILEQNNPIVALFTVALFGVGFIVSLVKFIKSL